MPAPWALDWVDMVLIIRIQYAGVWNKAGPYWANFPQNWWWPTKCSNQGPKWPLKMLNHFNNWRLKDNRNMKYLPEKNWQHVTCSSFCHASYDHLFYQPLSSASKWTAADSGIGKGKGKSWYSGNYRGLYVLPEAAVTAIIAHTTPEIQSFCMARYGRLSPK